MKKGFTLIELLVVVLIIGILAAIALPQYEKSVMRSRFTQMITAARSIAQAQQVFYMANGSYADNLADLDVTFSGANDTAVPLPGGICHLEVGRVTCSLLKNRDAGSVRTQAALIWYYENDRRICCAYNETAYEGDALCRTEMNNDSWYDGSGGGGGASHCYVGK